MTETMTPDKITFLGDVPLFESALRVQHEALHGSYAEVEELAKRIGLDALEVLYYAAWRQKPQLRSRHEHESPRSSNADLDPKEAVDDGWLTPAQVRKQMADSTEVL